MGAREDSRAWRKAHPEESREATRRWQAKHPERATEAHRARKYGLAAGQYDVMLKAQGGRCAVCGTDNLGKTFCVDHDHGTGVIRGLLCGRCNVALGLVRDDPFLLIALKLYLEKLR